MNRPFGLAPNIIKGDKAPIKFHETYRRIHHKSTLENLVFIEIERDNLESQIMAIASFASSTPFQSIMSATSSLLFIDLTKKTNLSKYL